jgi:hypothetical protein
MKSLLGIIIALMLPLVAVATECDCTITPFKPNPPCFATCTAKLVSEANFKQLTKIFRVPEVVSQKIMELPNRSNATTLDAYKKVLSEDEISTVKKVFENVTHNQLETFYKDRERNRISVER